MDDWFQHREKRGLFRKGCVRQGMGSRLLARIEKWLSKILLIGPAAMSDL